MFGHDCPAADPASYDADGNIIQHDREFELDCKSLETPHH
jgi:hypothetical protein